MSPRPAAPRSASVQAWATASPSLWPTTPGRVGKLDPTQHQPAVRVLGPSVDVEPLSDAQTHASNIARAAMRSSGSVILRFRARPSTTFTLPPAARTSETSSVASGRYGMGAAERRRREPLRGLDRPQRGTVNRIAVDVADGVRHGNDRDDRRRPVVERGHHLAIQRLGGQRTGGVVHQDPLGSVGHGRQTGPDRCRSRLAAGHDDRVVEGTGVGLEPVAGYDDHDAVGHRSGHSYRGREHRAVAQRLVLFRAAETAAGPGADDDDPDLVHSRERTGRNEPGSEPDASNRCGPGRSPTMAECEPSCSGVSTCSPISMTRP